MLIGLHVWILGMIAGPLAYFAAETQAEKDEAKMLWIFLWCTFLIPLICFLIFR